MPTLRPYILLSGCLFAAYAQANPLEFLKNMEISVGAGPSWFTANNGLVQATAAEQDQAVVNNVSSGLLKKIGLGYHLFAQQLADRPYLNDLLVELNYYHVNSSINGVVNLSGDPDFNYWNFRAPLSSTRLMLDIKPSLFTYQHISPYPILGMGLAWNHLSFNETPTFQDASDQGADTHLAADTNRQITYDLGLGARYAISEHLHASIDYIYNWAGNLTTSTTAVTGNSVITAPSFTTRSQNILVNLSWRF